MFRNTSTQSPAATPARSRDGGRALTLTAVAVVQFLVSLDLSVVNVGLPRIAAGLGFAPADLAWVVHAYALTFGGLLLLGGRAADRYGRKRVLLGGLTLFGLASAAGGLAQAPWQLIAARAAQGIGAAALAPAALAVLTATFPSGRARIRAFGVWSATNAGGGAVGVLLGGLLTEALGWRSVLLINVPMVAVALTLTARGVADTRATSRTAPDVVGAVLATLGVSALVLGVVRSTHYSWGSPVTVGTLAGAVVALAAFVLVERRRSAPGARHEPLVRIGLLTTRSVAGANSYNLLVGAAMATSFYLVSLYLQDVLRVSPALAGVMFLPFALGVVAGSFLAIKLGYRVPARTLMVVGALLTATGFGWFGLISADGSFLVDVLGPSILASVGFGLCLAPVVATATAGVAEHETGTASALLNSSRQLGASLGLAVLGTAALYRTGPVVTPETLTAGYGLGLGLAAVLLVGAAAIAFVVPRPTPDAAAPNAVPNESVPNESEASTVLARPAKEI